MDEVRTMDKTFEGYVYIGDDINHISQKESDFSKQFRKFLIVVKGNEGNVWLYSTTEKTKKEADTGLQKIGEFTSRFENKYYGGKKQALADKYNYIPDSIQDIPIRQHIEDILEEGE